LKPQLNKNKIIVGFCPTHAKSNGCDAVAFLFMVSSQFFSKRKTNKPPAMMVADKAFSFHLFFLYNLIVQAK
jgi:hypothetical protein